MGKRHPLSQGASPWRAPRPTYRTRPDVARRVPSPEARRELLRRIREEEAQRNASPPAQE